MSQIIEVPGQGNVEFPDDMGDEDIAKAIQANTAPPQEPSALSTFLKPFANVAEGLVNLPSAAYRAVKSDVGLIRKMAAEPSTIPEVAKATARGWGEALAEAGPTLATMAMGAAAAGPAGAVILPAVEKYWRSRIEGESIPQAYEKGATIGIGAALSTQAPSFVQRVLAPRPGAVTPQGQQLLQLGKVAGFQPSPADVAPGRTKIMPTVEALMEKQAGGGRITTAGEAEIAAMRGVPSIGKEGWLARRGREVAGPQMDASRVARGETIQSGLEDIARAHRVGQAVEWEFPRAQETGVPDFKIENLREHMRTRVAEQADLQQAITPATSSRLSSAGGITTPEGAFITEKMTRSGMTASNLVKGIAQGEGPITLRQAMTLRKALGEMYESGDKAPLAAFRQDMEADAGFNPKRANAWEAARNYTRENIVPFYHDQPMGRLIDKKEPVAVVQEMMLPRDARINTLRAIEKATGKQGPVWEAVQAEGLTQSIENPRAFKQMGPETRRTLFTPEQDAFLSQYQNWLETSTAPMKETRGFYARTGTNTVVGAQLREGVTLILGGLAAAGGAVARTSPALAAASPYALAAGTTILIAPNIVARMLTNPTTARWLTTGLQVPAGSSEAIRVISQVLPAYLAARNEERMAISGQTANRALRKAAPTLSQFLYRRE
jgi:hypothetical protein